jgi:hypothetical protein
MEGGVKFFLLKCLIASLRLGTGAQDPQALRVWLTRVTDREVRNRQEKFAMPQNPAPCWMWTQSGCKYPYGRRPTFCVFYLCDGLLLHMSWSDFRWYVWVSGKYLARLTRSMRAIFVQWQQQQRHTTTGSR